MSLFGKEISYGLVFLYFLYLYVSSSHRIKRSDWLVVLVFVLISIVHIVFFGVEVVLASLGFLLKLGIALLAVRVVNNFGDNYQKVVFGLSVVSLIFFVPQQLGLDLVSSLASLKLPLDNTNVTHIGIHNFHTTEELHRNSGMFWEPGAFAGYLVLAILFYMIGKKTLSSWQFIVLLLSLITTQSTTGYIAMFLLSLVYIYHYDVIRNKKLRQIVTPILLVLFSTFGYVLYESVPFLKNKIDLQWESAIYQSDNYEINRLGNFVYDLDIIEQRPFFGWSPRQSQRSGDIEIVSAQGNGLTGFAASFGLVGLLFYLYTIGKQFSRLFRNRFLGFLSTIIVTILLTGEQFLGYPMFIILMYGIGRERGCISGGFSECSNIERKNRGF